MALYQSGAADKIVLVALRNVNTGDTLDVGPTGIGVLQTCVRAVVIGIQGGAHAFGLCRWHHGVFGSLEEEHCALHGAGTLHG